jgi:hypothetical protein
MTPLTHQQHRSDGLSVITDATEWTQNGVEYYTGQADKAAGRQLHWIGLDWIGKGGTFLFGNFSPPKPFPIRNPRPAASGESEQCRRRGALLGSMIDHRQFAAQRDRESKSGHHNLLNNLRLCL